MKIIRPSFSLLLFQTSYQGVSSFSGFLSDHLSGRDSLSIRQRVAALQAIDDKEAVDAVPDEIKELLERAKAIRASLPKEVRTEEPIQTEAELNATFDEKVDESSCEAVKYKLYVDIGREDGTWMDRRWGASGRRIEFTLDVAFLLPNMNVNDVEDVSLAGDDIIRNMVKDNLSGKSSAVRILNASNARLRGGFDSMACEKRNGYRIDAADTTKRFGSSTVRFYVEVEGTKPEDAYGDISIPKGRLYFSLPCFGSSLRQLSSKQGFVTVRRIGWNTGWRREESRIVGIFRATKMN